VQYLVQGFAWSRFKVRSHLDLNRSGQGGCIVTIFVGFGRRLGTLEKKSSPTALITDEQAEEISSTVEALAELMTEKEPGKNHYRGIFSELYRRFGVSSYKNIRVEQYARVLEILENWRVAIQKKLDGAI
jgi:ORF6C domain